MPQEYTSTPQVTRVAILDTVTGETIYRVPIDARALTAPNYDGGRYRLAPTQPL